jgi:hypothetical protein
MRENSKWVKEENANTGVSVPKKGMGLKVRRASIEMRCLNFLERLSCKVEYFPLNLIEV